MNTATLHLKSVPRRILTAREAAEYCGMPIKAFAGLGYVKPIQLPGGGVRYDMRDLDEWLDGLKAGAPNGDDDIIGKLHK